jgi:D-sedoheptulose 7-phosphate isomerase
LCGIKEEIFKAYTLLLTAFEGGGKVLVAGNGGSAADAEHIVGELMKGFVKKRPLPTAFRSNLQQINADAADYIGSALQQGLPAIALSSHTALTSACINDIDGNSIYAQQVYGYGVAGDVFLGISTSGNAKNVWYAMITAKAKGLSAIALSGGSGGALVQIADVSIIVPETETYKIQELHLPIYHTLCLMVEDHFFT